MRELGGEFSRLEEKITAHFCVGVGEEEGFRMKVDSAVILSWSLGDGMDGQL